MKTSPRRIGKRIQAGFTLLETLIGLTIGVFLLGGIAVVLLVTRQNFNAQAGMGQLQDDQRIAVNMLVNVVEHAGYFYNPTAQTAANAFALTAPYVNAGQSVSGTSGTGTAADSVIVRYWQSPAGGSTADFMEDCNGATNTGATAVLSVNTFTLDSQNQLTCAVGGNAAKPLAAGISSFTVMYGVDFNNNKSVDAYLPASAMTAAYWALVGSVQVSIGFTNPLDKTRTITVKRVINLMNRA
jgi:type IV pilus assembly protein PilW